MDLISYLRLAQPRRAFRAVTAVEAGAAAPAALVTGTELAIIPAADAGVIVEVELAAPVTAVAVPVELLLVSVELALAEVLAVLLAEDVPVRVALLLVSVLLRLESSVRVALLLVSVLLRLESSVRLPVSVPLRLESVSLSVELLVVSVPFRLEAESVRVPLVSESVSEGGALRLVELLEGTQEQVSTSAVFP